MCTIDVISMQAVSSASKLVCEILTKWRENSSEYKKLSHFGLEFPDAHFMLIRSFFLSPLASRFRSSSPVKYQCD